MAVLGAGSWGTALAIQFARTARPTLLWGHDAEQLELLQSDRANKKYLPDAQFPPALQVEPSLSKALREATDVLVAVPSHAFREMLKRIKPLLMPGARLCWATKGFEMDSGKLPHEVAQEVLGAEIPMAMLAGPTFANEVGRGLPSAMTVASTDEQFASDIAASISTDEFRAYTTTDIIGVEVGAAVKNVLAIGAGISDGLGFGANTRVALITRGLYEMTQLGLALGARPDTFMGLAGMGDLVLTCTDNLSRNRRMGLALAAGKDIETAQAEIGQVVEGVLAARAVWEVAGRLDVEMPIAAEIYRVLYEGRDPRSAVSVLMGRELRREN
ncbi:MAG: NAD(P)-dependent glycerol-3-phosphate dehydrogenase [Gammaproteobacteria bacterium]|nr:NAD(P)-dependent glycerol-3-phosphate dehydrogenase [Gammaproteobacteria bacterium]NNF60142.1 NAD(P)-dependent glycerol-3-phosphate dehydrogenase [Gammaproteobacteria bacterium]NNM21554.1 NAD(P)-dependent glycerol-3-phosphate dehydrogenase [Gammaproteobacteria bacterium]